MDKCQLRNEVSVQRQSDTKNPRSHLRGHKTLAQLERTELGVGDMKRLV